MKKILITLIGAVLAVCLFNACDDTTEDIGISITDGNDNLKISTDTVDITTCSIKADSVFARTTIGYLGKVRDPETGAYITGNYMTQFHTFEDYSMPEKEKMVSLDEEGAIIADSCELRLFFRTFYGDSLAVMKLTAHELSKPMEEDFLYYSNYDPIKKGYVEQSGLKVDKIYTLADQNVSPTLRADANYTKNIRIQLNAPYTDAQGKTYNNYGTYIIQKYYENPQNLHNSYNFTHRVVPGFYFENSGGLGSMANIFATQLNVYFRYVTSADTISVGTLQFTGTEEVLQTTNVTNDRATIKRLTDDNTCTYVKSPAGIFTEMTIPVDQIMAGHEKDSLNTASIQLQRINDTFSSEYAIQPPTTILIIPKDSIYSFFENQRVCNYKTSFVSSYTASTNGYTFGNISNMVKEMYHHRHSTPDWNKAVLIPVTVQYNSTGDMTTCLHNMSMTSTKLIGGPENPNPVIKMSIIYGKFE